MSEQVKAYSQSMQMFDTIIKDIEAAKCGTGPLYDDIAVLDSDIVGFDRAERMACIDYFLYEYKYQKAFASAFYYDNCDKEYMTENNISEYEKLKEEALSECEKLKEQQDEIYDSLFKENSGLRDYGYKIFEKIDSKYPERKRYTYNLTKK